MIKTDVLNALWVMAMEAWPVGTHAADEGQWAYHSLTALMEVLDSAYLQRVEDAACAAYAP